MYQEQRLSKILELLKERDALSAKEMIDYLNVSRDTIRRDFSILENRGLAKRTHGGIISIDEKTQISSFNERIKEFTKAKKSIAKNAKEFIKTNSVCFFDVSTITLKLAAYTKLKVYQN
ncbi:DeoR family transcriptional regulator [Halanaerobium salsuginis]|jgi:DeoR/GlpR family transcriptional regulator of sugar metabolism|nr:DeoR family transcriptional regulator [Halanaerobium salsuginis]